MIRIAFATVAIVLAVGTSSAVAGMMLSRAALARRASLEGRRPPGRSSFEARYARASG